VPLRWLSLVFLLFATSALARTPSGLRDGVKYEGRTVTLASGVRVRVGRLLNAGYWSMGHEGKIIGTNERVAVKIWAPKWKEDIDKPPTYEVDTQLLDWLSAANPVWVRSHGTGHIDKSGESVLVTEFVDGKTLGAKKEARTIGKSVRILWQILGAIEAGHQQGFGFHDLNMDNEIISRDDRSATVRLFDTGGVRTDIDDKTITLDFGRAGGLLLNMLLPESERRKPNPEKLAQIVDPKLRAVIQNVLNRKYQTGPALAAALEPYYWRKELAIK
jgi:hypothetical protein